MAILPRRSSAARRREWLAQDRLRAGFEKALQRRMVAEIGNAVANAASAYRDGGLASMQGAFALHRVQTRAVIFPHYRVVMRTFGDRVLEQFKSAGPMETKDATNEFDRLLARWIVAHGVRKVQRITDTTRLQIMAEVHVATTEGLGVNATARRIVEKTGGVIARARANVIARTETHSASVAAGDQATDALNVKLQREWLAALDDWTRESHASANGQVRDQGQPFDVGGAKLMHPGDPTGPAREIISCRCSVGYLTPDP